MNKVKKVSKQKSQELNFSLLVLALVLFCFTLIIISTFTQLKLYAIQDWKLQQFEYIPQIPIILFISGLLGKRYGLISVVIYILIGLFLVPVFSLGGGLDYILNFNFGYILAYMPGVFFAAKIIEEKITLLRLLAANIVGVSIIHLIGIFYMTICLLIERESIQTILNWIKALSLNNLITDFLFGFAAICLGNFIKLMLKKIT